MRSPLASSDPQAAHESSSLSLLANVYEPLVAFDAQMRLTPVLAVSWTSPAEDVWRFELRRGVRFHDGRPFTARDVSYTLDRGTSDPASWVRSQVPLFAGVRVVDDHTLEVVTKRPAPLLLNELTSVFVVPAGSGDTLASRPIGTGPYRVAERRGAEVVLEAFADHWAGRPYWERAVIGSEVDGERRARAVVAGAADLADFPRIEDQAEIERGGRAKLLEQPGWSLAILGFRVAGAGEPFADSALREAVALVLDRRALVSETLGGHGIPAWQLAPPGVFGYVKDAPYEPGGLAAARAALSRSAHAHGVRARLAFTARDRRLAAQIAAAAAPLGVVFDPSEVPEAELGRLMHGGKAPAYLFRMEFPKGDSSDLLLDGLHSATSDGRYGRENFSGYADPSLDRVLEDSIGELDVARRFGQLRRAMEIAVAARAWVPLFVPSNLFAARPGLVWAGNPTGRILLAEIREER